MPKGSIGGRDLTYRGVIGAVKVVFAGLGQKFDIQGAEHIPAEGGVLIASNHISYTDFIFAGYAALPRRRLVRFMAKQELFKHKISGPLMRAMSHIPVDRGAGTASIRTALTYLDKGEAVGIFPEATISRAWEIKDIKSGAVRIAAEAGVPLVPMALFGTHRLLTKGQRLDLTRRRTVVIRVGEPIICQEDDLAGQADELKKRLEDLLADAMAAYPEDGAGQWWWPTRLGGSAPTLEGAKRLDIEERAARIARRRR